MTDDIFEPPIPIVPDHWDLIPFMQAVTVVSDNSRRLKQSDYLDEGAFPVIDQGQQLIGGYTNDETLLFKGSFPVILFGDHTRTIKYVEKPFAVGAEGVKILSPKNNFTSKYLYYLLCSLPIPGRGYSRHFQFLRKFQLQRPPPDMQKRIVAEIEKQFSRLDEAVTNLKRVKANLKRYRASVLKAAVEGRLVETEAEIARREGREYETGKQLLERILEMRRREWKGKGQYKEPSAPDVSELPEMPEGWAWGTVEQMVADSLIGLDRGREHQHTEPIGVPYIKMNNVDMDGTVSYENIVYVDGTEQELTRFTLNRGDLLFNTRNSKELVGKVGVVHNPPNGAIFNNNLMRLRVQSNIVPEFLLFQMCSRPFRQKMELIKKATTNVAAIYAKDLFPLPVALPPLAEQRRIVAEVDRRLSLVRETEAQVEANLKRAERLRQSVLQKAFSGELVRDEAG